MKYTVYSEDGDEFTLETADTGGVVVDGTTIYTKEGFKELRRAVGYIWQELEEQR